MYFDELDLAIRERQERYKHQAYQVRRGPSLARSWTTRLRTALGR